jgi:uncharacterized protein (DUF2062 family)
MNAYLHTAYRRFVRIRGTPREIALGFALGLFVGFTPTMGAQILIAVFLASVFKWNKITAVIGVQITNPLTAPLIYGFTYIIGAKLIGLEKPLNLTLNLDWHSIFNMLDQAPRIFLALTIGGIIIGIPASIIGYIAIYIIVDRYQEGLKEKVKNKKENIKEKLSALKKKYKN